MRFVVQKTNSKGQTVFYTSDGYFETGLYRTFDSGDEAKDVARKYNAEVVQEEETEGGISTDEFRRQLEEDRAVRDRERDNYLKWPRDVEIQPMKCADCQNLMRQVPRRFVERVCSIFWKNRAYECVACEKRLLVRIEH